MTGPLLDVLVAMIAHVVVLAAAANRRRAQQLARGWLDGLLDVIRRSGVTNDEEAREIAQDTLTAAWRGIASGRYQPTPRADRMVALQAYLHGAAWKIAERRVAQRRARRRRELPAKFAPEPSRDPTPQIEARSALVWWTSRATERDAVLLARRALGDTHAEVGGALGIPPGYAEALGREARARAAKILAEGPRICRARRLGGW